MRGIQSNRFERVRYMFFQSFARVGFVISDLICFPRPERRGDSQTTIIRPQATETRIALVQSTQSKSTNFHSALTLQCTGTEFYLITALALNASRIRNQLVSKKQGLNTILLR